jgi:hypothetical protein
MPTTKSPHSLWNDPSATPEPFDVRNSPASPSIADPISPEGAPSRDEREDGGATDLMGSRKRGTVDAVLRGAAGGAVATCAMTAVMLAEQKLGLLGRMPPKKLVRGARRKLGIFGVSDSADNLLTTAGHFGFGIAVGALYGLLNRKKRDPLAGALVGAGYATAVWATSYAGWIPALGLMRPPRRDRPFRPTSMVAAHWVFGGVLGAFVDATSHSSHQ